MSDKVISDYNGYDYKKIFWEDADREYEDQADRMAIRKLLPKRMDKFADIGGGYGRLANEYLKRAHTVIIFDYSKSELEQAKEIYGDRIETRAGDIYKLPFKDAELDGLMMVRVTSIASSNQVALPSSKSPTSALFPKWPVMLPAVPKSIPSTTKLPITKTSPLAASTTIIPNMSKTFSTKPVSTLNASYQFLISAAKD